ncbi:MAG: hypothetical protein JSS09_07975 [Verrucomicrobia bacterium]|nr:hypothetical protein [Verrucomicrobiota bacterium]
MLLTTNYEKVFQRILDSYNEECDALNKAFTIHNHLYEPYRTTSYIHFIKEENNFFSCLAGNRCFLSSDDLDKLVHELRNRNISVSRIHGSKAHLIAMKVYRGHNQKIHENYSGFHTK